MRAMSCNWTSSQSNRLSEGCGRKLVCNNMACFKWIFILYLAFHSRLLTKDRLANWGCVDDVDCVLCGSEGENTSHLFFNCSFSAQIWQKVLWWLNIHKQVCNWENETSWAVTHCKGKQPRAEVYRIALASSVYHIWQERNNRIFKVRIEMLR
ncbi:hypothetical protein K7X08_006627 [Anisodus acutangulus]|uniref:Reverse transcriptase zinc-binding domain-containing protein n=1 Tax=Anisodus acutangulus TaxID=402998 RepID=A0A9Q1MZ80_9SOLA|nr:hypothetical protein K7X08_006627 [Anisodus acutangulus]